MRMRIMNTCHLHPHVASKNLPHIANSDACSDSHHFCLAMKALVIADCLGVEEQVAGVCGVYTALEEAVLDEGNVDSTS